ncbi:MAG: ATP-binding cassette domain-containing protein [Lentisphaeria bacterium]|nr:ATP-binding cassette domain-containing protein [Lentisphaeria bacterium]
MPENIEEYILKVENLNVWFPIHSGIFSKIVGHVKAVNGASLQIKKGETLGLVGESGCGKTTLGRAILGLESTYAGKIFFEKHLIASQDEDYDRNVAAKHIQMIFQDPFASLNPRKTILEIISEGLIQHNRIKKSPEEDVGFWLEEVGLIPSMMNRFPHEFSGGQRQRICIARSISMQPDLLVCDESVSALDVSVQAQVINLLMDLQKKYQFSYLFISHDLSVVRHISDRIAVMYLGNVVEVGDSEKILDSPQHPYTEALVSAIPVPLEEKKDRIVLKGEVPSPASPPSGCAFHTRCRDKMKRCMSDKPTLKPFAGRNVACWLHEKN